MIWLPIWLLNKKFSQIVTEVLTRQRKLNISTAVIFIGIIHPDYSSLNLFEINIKKTINDKLNIILDREEGLHLLKRGSGTVFLWI